MADDGGDGHVRGRERERRGSRDKSPSTALKKLNWVGAVMRKGSFRIEELSARGVLVGRPLERDCRDGW